MLGVVVAFWVWLKQEPPAHATLRNPQKNGLYSKASLPSPAPSFIGHRGPPPRAHFVAAGRLPPELLPLHRSLMLGVQTLKQILETRAKVLTHPLGAAWESEKQGTSSRIQTHLLTELQGRHFLFTAGFLNEFSRLQFDYFSVPIQTLERTYGTTVQFFGPQSHRSTLDNVQPLYEAVTAAHAETGKPVVLIGHSKGGCEALLLSLRHPELLLEGVLDRTIVLQAPIQGVAFLDHKASHPLLKIAGCVFGEGLSCLQPKKAQLSLESSYALMQEKLKKAVVADIPGIEATLHQWMSERIFFVRSTTPSKNRHRILQLFLNVLQFDPDTDGPNDGILTLSTQSTPLIGTDLGWVEADHLDLVSGAFDHEDAGDVAAFHRALWCTLFGGPTTSIPTLEHQAMEWLDSLSVLLEPMIQP
jgi:pimeloyl-ACP methyl ester carboxylesterase